MFSGTGPGLQTGDGCSVELYRLLPYFGELDPVRAFLPHASSVLELGSGAGRLTRQLLSWGLRPTAVDFSSDMLAHLPEGTERICSSIQDLHLRRSSDVVLLASCLINHPDESVRAEYARCAGRHLRVGGRFIVERHDPDWLETVECGPVGTGAPVRVFVDRVDRGVGSVAMQLRWELDGQSWSQEFAACALRENQIERELAAAGFGRVSWHGPGRRWAVAQWGAADAT